MITRFVACTLVTALLITGGTMLAVMLVARGGLVSAGAVVVLTAVAVAFVRSARHPRTRVPHVVPAVRPAPGPPRAVTGTLRLAPVAPVSSFVHYHPTRPGAGGAS